MRFRYLTVITSIMGSLVVGFLLVVVKVRAQGAPELSDVLQLKAQLLQLQGQLQKLSTEQVVCVARLALANQGQLQQDLQKQRLLLEKDAGCSLKWDATPLRCQ